MTLSNRDSNRIFPLSVRARVVCACIGLTLFATFAPGCTTRKQYAINEAILIGERRQLEDEIYQTQFELRDALVENERLRAELEGRGKDAKSKSKDANAPANSSVRYPGGSALQVAPSSSDALGAYGSTDGEEIERLPDFVPVPVSRAKQNGVPTPPTIGSKSQTTPTPPTIGPTNRPSTTPNSTGGSNRRSTSPKASSSASGVETTPYTFGQNVAPGSNASPQIASSAYLSAPSGSNKIGQTSYQGKVQNDPEIEPWSPLAPY